MRLTGKVAAVTGGANGIGAATSARFLEEGASVVIADVNVENARRCLDEAASAGHGDRIEFVATDVLDERAMASMLAATVDRFGRLDCMFNNAGVGGAVGPISQTDVGDWDFTIGVLLRGVFIGMKHAARILQDQGEGGSIISTSSVAGFTAGSGGHAYSAAKAAVNNLTRSVAVELAADRIRVNAVAPGAVMTDLYHRGRHESAEDRVLSVQPWPTVGTAMDVAALVAFLASDDATFITGETVVIDGGLLARGAALFGHGRENILFQTAGVDHGSTGRR
jgi:NAD(P)-dependent dehydrogenase (short-subunit alcohol dehydrogenase family)